MLQCFYAINLIYASPIAAKAKCMEINGTEINISFTTEREDRNKVYFTAGGNPRPINSWQQIVIK